MPISEPGKDWVNGIIAKLELLDTECVHVRENERLEVEDLSRVLELFASSMNKFIIICELHGFKQEKK